MRSIRETIAEMPNPDIEKYAGMGVATTSVIGQVINKATVHEYRISVATLAGLVLGSLAVVDGYRREL